jgi:hypothetical protein
METVWSYLSISCFVVAAIFIVLSVYFFFKLDIRELILENQAKAMPKRTSREVPPTSVSSEVGDINFDFEPSLVPTFEAPTEPLEVAVAEPEVEMSTFAEVTPVIDFEADTTDLSVFEELDFPKYNDPLSDTSEIGFVLGHNICVTESNEVI